VLLAHALIVHLLHGYDTLIGQNPLDRRPSRAAARRSWQKREGPASGRGAHARSRSSLADRRAHRCRAHAAASALVSMTGRCRQAHAGAAGIRVPASPSDA
jgi:hypothetical protein